MKRTRLVQPMLLAGLAAATLLSGCVVRGTVGIPAPTVYVESGRRCATGTFMSRSSACLRSLVTFGSVATGITSADVTCGSAAIGAAGRPGYRWVPHEWVRGNGGWRLREGHWARG